MELTLRTVVVLIIILVSAVVFVSLILGWGGQAREWFNDIIAPLRDMFFG